MEVEETLIYRKRIFSDLTTNFEGQMLEVSGNLMDKSTLLKVSESMIKFVQPVLLGKMTISPDINTKF